ncbi:centrosomal protein of 112 kDa-like [Hydractinia symbiolongicarpus]|uniref:centrosomal protein of 112 kDa-like n=1 Tax=Hydractinia symbiolongicarpus TaxID=13093 RepID=UPI00254CBFF5|nr:centrosomal protein of 112 kDa-like [Hydractinia symbiolongicarpus]
MSRRVTSEENQVERLDTMLKEFVEDMKPYVLNLKTKDEKQTISAWIKKLCHPSITTVVERKNRNLYAQILLHMLLKDEIREPFLMKPSHGKLPTIPAYMSNYLDSTNQSKQQRSFTGPEWLQGEEFEDSILSQTMSHQSYNKYKDVLSPKKREKFMLSPPTLGPTTEAKFKKEKHSMDYLELSDLNELEKYLQENKENFSSTKRLKSNDDVGKIYQEKSPKQLDDRLRRPTTTKTQSNREKELELKLRLTEGKIQEETLKIQQQHDQMIKKILDRKNNEITDVKSYYQKKIAELENSLQQHGKTEKQLNDDMMIIREKHALEVDELKDAIRRSAANTATEYEKVMYDKLSDFENEIFNLQKVHRQNINELVAEADGKMKIMTDGFSKERKEMASPYILNVFV